MQRKRLTKERAHQNEKRANESSECREKRLASMRTHQREKHANESAECREKRQASNRAHQNKVRAKESAEYREETLAKQCEYDQRNYVNVCNSSTVADEKRKFHHS